MGGRLLKWKPVVKAYIKEAIEAEKKAGFESEL